MKGFCEKCRDMTECNVKMVDKKKDIKGRTVSCISKVAYCNECEEELFVPEIRDYNLKVLDAAYRKAEGLINVDEIEEILEKYDIGKRPLSLLLGWGEGTLTRYVDGDTPSKPYSNILKQILKNKDYYREILEQNQQSISSIAYRKSITSVDAIKEITDNEVNKLESAVRYLLIQTSEITPLALQKLLYFAQGFRKAFSGTFMFEEDCEAWVHGPVYRNVFYKYRDYGYNPIEEKELFFENINLEDDEKELLHHIVLYFGCYSGRILENMTHLEEPWRVARRGLADLESSDKIIEKKEMDSYFNSIKEKYKMLDFADIKEYSKDLFDKVYS